MLVYVDDIIAASPVYTNLNRPYDQLSTRLMAQFQGGRSCGVSALSADETSRLNWLGGGFTGPARRRLIS